MNEENTEANNINLSAARGHEQQKQYSEIARSGLCPFCPEHYGSFEYQDRPVRESEHWFAINNMKPYEFTEFHRVIIAKRHLQFPDELTDEEWVDLLRSHIEKERVERALGYGAIGMRFGDPVETGASVGHLHVHLIVPDSEQVSAINEVKFRMSRKFGKASLDVSLDETVDTDAIQE